MDRPTLVLTLRLDMHSFTLFDQLRRRYFPRDRNLVPAHVTLFHALPGEMEQNLARAIERICLQTPVLNLLFDKVRFLGRGVAVEISCPGLLKLQNRLASEWGPWLIPQDKGGYRPHITIQNKVDALNARGLFEHMVKTWRPFGGTAPGLQLWHYRAGPWDLAREFSFKAQDA